MRALSRWRFHRPRWANSADLPGQYVRAAATFDHDPGCKRFNMADATVAGKPAERGIGGSRLGLAIGQNLARKRLTLADVVAAGKLWRSWRTTIGQAQGSQAVNEPWAMICAAVRRDGA